MTTPSTLNQVQDRLRKVVDTFQQSELLVTSNNRLMSLQEELNKLDGDFLSIAYESASMAIATIDLNNNNEDLSNWTRFADANPLHSTQIYIGLGLGMAKIQQPPTGYLEQFEPMLRWRVVDGCGYYDGFFKRRHTVLKQSIPHWITPLTQQVYDQGVGRSLWYLAQGELEKLLELVGKFDSKRRSNLWRGIGIAVTYIGGCSSAVLEEMKDEAGSNLPALAAGSIMAIQSRNSANTLNQQSTDICEILTGLSTEKAVQIANDKVEHSSNEPYFNWVENLESQF